MALITDTAYLLHSLRLHHLRATPTDPHSSRIISLSPVTLSNNPYVRASGLSDPSAWPEVPRGLESPGLRERERARDEPSRRYARGDNRRREEVEKQREGKDPTVTLEYSTTIGKPSSLYNPGLRLSTRDPPTASSSAATTRAPRDRIRSSTFSTSPSASPAPPLSTDRERTPRTLSTLSTLPLQPSPLNPSQPASPTGPLPPSTSIRHTRPRADSAPVLVLTSPGGHGSASRLEPISPRGVGSQAFAALGMGMGMRRGSTSTGTGEAGEFEYGTSFYGSGRGGAVGSILERAMSESEATQGTGTSFDGDIPEEREDALSTMDRQGSSRMGEGSGGGSTPGIGGIGRSMGMSLGLGEDLGSDEDEEVMEEDEGEGEGEEEGDEEFLDAEEGVISRKNSALPNSRRGSRIPTLDREPVIFTPVPITPGVTIPSSKPSGLSLLFNPPSASSQPTLSSNPFLALYSSVPPTSSSAASLSLTLFFPHSSVPDKALVVTVRKEATVEEVIGWALGRYWEEGREPGLLEAAKAEGEEGDREREIRGSTVGWGLRIAEDDGEVDEDFPPLDRDGQIGKFNFEAFAIVEATPAQVRANLAKQPLRALPSQQPSQPTLRTPAASTTVAGSVAMSKASGSNSSFEGAASMMMGAKVAGVGGMMVLLRVRITSSADLHFTTTINVPSEMYFADIIELLIAKKRLTPSNPTQWVLLLGDASMALPLDRTVESLMGAADLALVRRAWAETHRLVTRGTEGEMRGGDPNMSVFKRMSEPPPPGQRVGGGPMMDFASTYKKYLVQRKMPIGRHERILAIDGDYIHIMPSENKAFFDSMKTSSFHVTSITSCKQASKAPATFKIDVWREGGDKRYEFEAEKPKQALEIVTAIRNLMKMYQSERNYTQTGKTRRKL